MRKMSTWDWIAWVIVIIGAINWGLIGFFAWDLVAAIFGDMTATSRVIYSIVGLAGVYMIIKAIWYSAE